MATRVMCVLLMSVVWVVAPATAQRVDYRISGMTTAHGIVDLGAGVSVATAADDAQVDAVFTSDGQYAVTAGTRTLRIRHVPTGMQTTVPVDFRPVLAHPRQPMLFGYAGAGELARLDARGLTRLTPCPGVTTVTGFDLAIDGQHVFVACPSTEIVVLDTETGADVRRLTGVPAGIRFVAVNAAGELVVFLSGSATSEVARLDAHTGQVLARRPALSIWTRTGSRRQVMESNCTVSPGAPCAHQLVDTATLGVSRVLPGAGPFFPRVFVSPDGHEVVFNDAGVIYPPSRATRLHVTTGQVLNDIVMAAGDTIEVNYVPVPLPPVSPRATVTGNTVTLSWRPAAESPQASGYRLDLGAAPGATDLGSISVGPSETFSAAAVPAGRYYVRVRAVNYTGTSVPSLELVVDVP